MSIIERFIYYQTPACCNYHLFSQGEIHSWISLWVFIFNVVSTVLLAVHDALIRDSLQRFFSDYGWSVSIGADNCGDILAGLQRQKGYPPTLLVMDLNYGRPNSMNIGPAELVFGYTSQNGIKFLGFSGNDIVVSKAVSIGIPAFLKGPKVLDTLEGLIKECSLQD